MDATKTYKQDKPLMKSTISKTSKTRDKQDCKQEQGDKKQLNMHQIQQTDKTTNKNYETPDKYRMM